MAWNTKARPALIITLQRTGGSFLAYCLSNHPEIFCTRDEPLSKRSVWHKTAGTGVAVLNLIFTQHDYEVAMCKLISSHAFSPEVWKFITSTRGKGRDEIRLVWLERGNIVAQAVSHEINAGKRLGTVKGHPTHTYARVNVPPVRLDPAGLLKRCASDIERRDHARRKIKESRLPCLRLAYKEITGASDAAGVPEQVGRRACEFLGVTYSRLYCRLRKIHTGPYREMIANWAEVREALAGGGYADEVAEIERGAFC